MPVKPDVHVKEEPDGPVLKRCRTVSPAHVLMPSVMEMIAALGPGAAPFAPLQPPSAPAPGDYPSQGEYGGPGPGTQMATVKRSVLSRPVKCHCAGPAPGALLGDAAMGVDGSWAHPPQRWGAGAFCRHTSGAWSSLTLPVGVSG